MIGSAFIAMPVLQMKITSVVVIGNGLLVGRPTSQTQLVNPATKRDILCGMREVENMFLSLELARIRKSYAAHKGLAREL